MPIKISIPEALSHHSTSIGGSLFIGGLILIVASGEPPALVAGAVVALQGGILLQLGARSHQGNLCTRCAAAMPLNPGGEAENRLWVLNLLHHILDRPRSHKIIGLGAFVVAMVVIPVWALPVFATSIVAFQMVTNTHHRYAAWCPHCNPRNGGGGGDYGPPLVPVGSGGRSLIR